MNQSIVADNIKQNLSQSSTSNLQGERRNSTVLIAISLVIVLVNSLVILAFSTNKNIRRRPANVLICSQACIDLFTGIVFIPTFLLETYRGKHEATPFLTCYILFLSLFNLLALSTDRYLALSKPLLHHRMIDLRRTLKLIGIIWFVPLGLTLIPLTWWFEPKYIMAQAGRYYLTVVWIFMLLLVVAMTILYIFVTTKAKRTIRSKRESIAIKNHTRQIALARKELRVIHLFGLLLFFFVAAYLPILYMNFCDILGKAELIPEELETVGHYSLFLNSIVNPVLCIYLKKDYLRAVARVSCFKGQFLRKLSHMRMQSTKERKIDFDSVDDVSVVDKYTIDQMNMDRCSSSGGQTLKLDNQRNINNNNNSSIQPLLET